MGSCLWEDLNSARLLLEIGQLDISVEHIPYILMYRSQFRTDLEDIHNIWDWEDPELPLLISHGAIRVYLVSGAAGEPHS